MIVAALLNASASVLQRRATKAEPESAAFSLRMVLDLVRQPVWILGILTMIAGFLLHAVSLSLSQIALVQPLLVSELPFTLLLASWAFGLRIPRRDWGAIAMQSAGLAAFVGCLSPTGGDPRVPTATWVLGVGVTVTAVAALVVLGYRGRHEHRAALLGVATGATFGLNSALIAGVAAEVGHGGGLLTTWQTYGVIALAPTSFFLLQNALQAGNLVASQPGFTLTNPLVSVAWGLAVFNEQARGGVFVIGTIAGAVLIGVGTAQLARSRLLDPATAPRESTG
ncbi:drug/metabolite transporter (DMT)-like permease [Saccharopolyspora lacisalsi]|uniref:Drug/metabolite transporter (DMT)-like permease n=1 Tax=Halosaccharopolyspora lacisalsi TaxID=1000566 RepID=A0A839DUX0_9PSEU|nr:DMT family transporter [Halosaccharopolyspora lacisalsi]MBA8824710.1 drug/metabolite transporter (DMT)-like permease [Halosaccharopolyspora lacisalsi]